MRKEIFAPGAYYHIYSRIIFGNPEFKDFKTASKFAQNLLLANSTESSAAFRLLRNKESASPQELLEVVRSGERIVDVVAYAIMPNHFHLLVRELKKNGVTNFMHKGNTSIAKYINTKKERKGPLFESNFNAKHIDSNEYLLHLSLYIHLNPLDFIDDKSWRKGGLKNWNLEKKKLLEYPWSSLKCFLDQSFYDSIISGTDIILDQFRNRKEYEEFLKEWSGANFEKIQEIL